MRFGARRCSGGSARATERTLPAFRQSKRYCEGGFEYSTRAIRSDMFLVVVSGRVKIVKMTPAGKDVILEIFGTGDPVRGSRGLRGTPVSCVGDRTRGHRVPADATLGVFRAAGAASVARARAAARPDTAARRVDEPPYGDDRRTGRSADRASLSQARRQHGTSSSRRHYQFRWRCRARSSPISQGRRSRRAFAS